LPGPDDVARNPLEFCARREGPGKLVSGSQLFEDSRSRVEMADSGSRIVRYEHLPE
jgi:hypothetical protein